MKVIRVESYLHPEKRGEVRDYGHNQRDALSLHTGVLVEIKDDIVVSKEKASAMWGGSWKSSSVDESASIFKEWITGHDGNLYAIRKSSRRGTREYAMKVSE